MSEKAEIKKIVLDLGGVEVSLTPDQAKKLHDALDEIYGIKNNIPYNPIIIERYRPYWHYGDYTWYGSGIQMSYTANDCTAKLSL